jgi:transposase InsO family protein
VIRNLVAIMDWHSRRALDWRLSTTLDANLCLEALEEARQRSGTPAFGQNAVQLAPATAQIPRYSRLVGPAPLATRVGDRLNGSGVPTVLHRTPLVGAIEQLNS